MFQFLSVKWDISPEIMSIGPIHLRYYGVLMVSGFIVSYFVLRKAFCREQLSKQLLDNLTVVAIVSTLIGARLGHCLFYEPQIFLTHPLEIIFPVRFSPHFEIIGYQGLASHGAAIGILLGMLWWSRKHKIPYLWTLERIVLIVPLAGAFIRLGNLMNSEIYGGETSLPWGFVFVNDRQTAPHHPTQLYEAFAYVVIFFIMWRLYTKKLPQLKRGMLFGIFLILLFGARFGIEFIKNVQVTFENGMFLKIGQILSLPFIIAGVIILYLSWMYGKPEQGWLVRKKNGNKTK